MAEIPAARKSGFFMCADRQARAVFSAPTLPADKANNLQSRKFLFVALDLEEGLILFVL